MKLPLIHTLNELRAPSVLAVLAALVFCLGPVPRAGAQTTYKSSSQPHGTSIRIDGTSTAHDWEWKASSSAAPSNLGPA